MDLIVTPKEADELLHGEKACKSTENVIRRRCVEGTIKNAEKIGVRWYINATREWPHLFPDEVHSETGAKGQAAPRITMDTTVAELLSELIALMAAQPAGEKG